MSQQSAPSPQFEGASNIQKPRISEHARIWGGFLGVGVLVLAVIGAVVMYWATSKQIERANGQVAELLAKLGAAQERTTTLEANQQKAVADLAAVTARVHSLSDLVARLESVDQSKLARVLDLAERPEMLNAADVSKLQLTVQELDRNVTAVLDGAERRNPKPKDILDEFRIATPQEWVESVAMYWVKVKGKKADAELDAAMRKSRSLDSTQPTAKQ